MGSDVENWTCITMWGFVWWYLVLWYFCFWFVFYSRNLCMLWEVRFWYKNCHYNNKCGVPLLVFAASFVLIRMIVQYNCFAIGVVLLLKIIVLSHVLWIVTKLAVNMKVLRITWFCGCLVLESYPESESCGCLLRFCGSLMQILIFLLLHR